jgi:hypothetical protein
LRFDVLTAVKMSIMVQRTAFILRPEGEGSKHFPLKLLFPHKSALHHNPEDNHRP